jgi:hypothetical protein
MKINTELFDDKELKELQERIDQITEQLADLDKELQSAKEGEEEFRVREAISELNTILINLQKQRNEREDELLKEAINRQEKYDKAKTALLTYLFPPLRLLKWGKKAVFVSVGCLVGLCCCFLFVILGIVLFNEIQSGTNTIDNALFVADNCTGDKSLPECFKCISLESMAARGGEELDLPTCE